MLINQFISPILFKLFIGSVLTSVMIISLTYISLDLYTFLARYEYGGHFKLGFFSFAFLISLWTLFTIFSKEKIQSEREISVDINILALHFFKGFSVGLTATNK